MDAGVDPTELDALRRRAYGPDADLDAVGLARLQHLEDLVRASASPPAEPSRSAPSTTSPFPQPEGQTGSIREPGPEISDVVHAPRRSRRAVWALLAAGAVAVLVVGAAATLLGQGPAPDAAPTPTPTPPATAAEQFAYTPDPTNVLLLRIPLDGSFGSYIDLPPTAQPRSLRAGDTVWSEPLGTYYGWDLWIARGLEGSACTVLRRGEESRGGCLKADAIGTMAPALAYADVTSQERPDGMDPGTSIVFWWMPGEVTVVLSPTS